MTKLWILLLFTASVDGFEEPGVYVGSAPTETTCRIKAELRVEGAPVGSEVHCLQTKGTKT